MKTIPLLYKLPAIFFWGGCIVVGILIGNWSIHEILLDRDSQSWPTTSGYILTSTISIGRSRSGPTYWPHITYKYQVDNHSYTNSTIAFGQNGSATQRYAKLTTEKYAPNVPITIYYDPKDPQRACLEPGNLISETYIALGIAGFLLIAGVGGLIRIKR